MNYPQYRKYKNNKSYFKISSPEIVEEIQQVGDKYVLHTLTAKILPDRNFIADMLFDYTENWDLITEDEYISFRASHV